MAAHNRQRRFPLTLPADEYRVLERLAAASERDAWQHARFLLRKAIADERGRGPADGAPRALPEPTR